LQALFDSFSLGFAAGSPLTFAFRRLVQNTRAPGTVQALFLVLSVEKPQWASYRQNRFASQQLTVTAALAQDGVFLRIFTGTSGAVKDLRTENDALLLSGYAHR